MYWFDILDLLEDNKNIWFSPKELAVLYEKRFGRKPTYKNFVKALFKLSKSGKIEKKEIHYRRIYYRLKGG